MDLRAILQDPPRTFVLVVDNPTLGSPITVWGHQHARNAVVVLETLGDRPRDVYWVESAELARQWLATVLDMTVTLVWATRTEMEV